MYTNYILYHSASKLACDTVTNLWTCAVQYFLLVSKGLMCLCRNVMIVCGVIHPGHPMFFTVNCMCNIEKHEMACFAKNQQKWALHNIIIGIHPGH